jgi:hypothetical protein
MLIQPVEPSDVQLLEAAKTRRQHVGKKLTTYGAEADNFVSPQVDEIKKF